jgi:Ca2+-binding RTX toxin-like protein
MATIFGNFTNDPLTGTPINDSIYGRGGNDVLLGMSGDDYLNGEQGSDRLVGGLGRDVLYGGTGADRFDFNSVAETVGDVIADFSRLEGDKIDLRDIDAKDLLWDDAFAWQGNIASKALGMGELGFYYDNGATHVYGNTDWDTNYEISFLVSSVTSLTASDFYL